MPSPLISILLLFSTLILTVRCLLTNENASADLDSSQQPPAVDYNFYDSPATNFLASNNPNLDSTTTPTSSTDTTFGINNKDLDSSSSQQELPEQDADDSRDDGFGTRITTPSSAEPPLLLSSDECDKSQDSGGRHPNTRANKKRMRKRQLRNCPNPNLTSPNQAQSGKTGQLPTMAIPGLILQEKPLPNLSLCPEVERPIPVCGREDTKIPMGDSFLIPNCHACKFYIYIFFRDNFFPLPYPTSPPLPPYPRIFQTQILKSIPSHPPPPFPREGEGGWSLGTPTYRYSICRL